MSSDSWHNQRTRTPESNKTSPPPNLNKQLNKNISALPPDARPGVTYDNGTEFARHAELRYGLGMATYFADPYSSWQRGSNENRNGMIRRYLPKRAAISPDMTRDVQEIVDETDNRPMRELGYRTPAEAFTDELLDLQTKQGRCTYK